MKEEQTNKQPQSDAETDKRVNTPEPPQRKNPLNKSEAARDGHEESENKSGTADRKPGPAAQKEQNPPTTTTNRNR